MTAATTAPATTPAADAPASVHEVVVLGCDGSPAGQPAVAFAVREAMLRGARLHAVAAYDVPLMPYGFAFATLAYGQLPEEVRESIERAVREQVEQVRAAQGGVLDLEVSVTEGRPSAVLLAASAGAALLVVGARGLGAWGRMVTGSTSTEVVHHAEVPVVVVPGSDPS